MGRSDFLFPDASFVTGAGSVLDLFGLLVEYNDSKSSAEADLRALKADWAAVGQHLWAATVRAPGEASERTSSTATG